MDSFLILFLDRIYRIVRILFTGFSEESLGGGKGDVRGIWTFWIEAESLLYHKSFRSMDMIIRFDSRL